MVMKISTIKSNNRNLEYYFGFGTRFRSTRSLNSEIYESLLGSIITHLKSISFPVRRRSPGNEVAVKCNRLQLKIHPLSFDFLNRTHFNSSEGLP